jgi:UPF0176 protein
MNRIENISFYRFVEIPAERLPELRAELRAHCMRLALKGTVLLSREGVNGFLAGTKPAMAEIKTVLCGVPGFSGLDFKVSYSTEIPFRRMLVKLKKEIISMGREDVRPAQKTAPRLEPEQLKQWLDEGREVVLVDTRNEYEIELGTFKGARSFGLNTFRPFPIELAKHREELAGKPVVMFCTGGIRCEKAGAIGLEQGLDAYQLEGGILRYFEKVGGAHYEGDCFVFDRRVAVDPQLQPTTRHITCYECRTVHPANEKCPSGHPAEAS